MKLFSEKWAPIYQREHKRTPQVAPFLLGNPQIGLEYFLHNGFARAGGEQAGYGNIAVKALRNSLSSTSNFETLIEHSQETVWAEFEKLCKEEGIGVNKRLNEGVIKGFVELCKESSKHNYNPFSYVATKIPNSMTDAFLILRNIKGIGDKVAAFLLRDMVCIMDLEAKVPSEHRIYLQPIDRWVREVAYCLWEDLGDRPPDWVIALRIIDKCNEFGISGVRFNQGAWQYGTTEIIEVSKLRAKLQTLLTSEERR
jgi:hypothetical protein